MDHPVRALRGLAEEVLGPRLRSRCLDRGGIPHDPVGMLCVWLYGMLEGEASSRKLEEKCRYDLRYEYLCFGTRPDHTTLSRFRERLGVDMDCLLADLSETAAERGLLPRRALAIDGTKVPARRSQWSKALAHVDETEAAQLRGPRGQFLYGYNMQAAADVDTGYIAGFEATRNANDTQVAEAVLSAVERQSKGIAEMVVADTGYDAPATYAATESRGIVPVVAQSRTRRLSFEQDDSGMLRCPKGHVPKVRQGYEHGRLVRIYQVSKCARCELKATCGVKGRQKRAVLSVGDTPESAHQRRRWAESDDGRSLLRLRGPTIERVFAVLKSVMGLRRFKLKGLAGARLEFGIAVLAYNLRLVLRLFQAHFNSGWTALQ